MSDQFLYQFQKQPPHDFSGRLYQNINIVPPRKGIGFTAVACGLASLLVIMGLVIGISPAARVYAQEIIYNIGQWVITHQPTAADQFEEKLASGEIQENDVVSKEGIEWQAPTWLTLAEAQSKAGFPLHELSVDKSVFVPLFREVDTGDESIAVTTVYRSGETIISFRQTKVLSADTASELAVGDAVVTEVQVLDEIGYWVEGLRLSAYVNDENKVEPKFANVLVWETDEFEFWLQSSPGLPLEDMLKMIQ